MRTRSTLLSIACLLLLSISMFAEMSADVSIGNNVSFGGTKVSAGNYKVAVEGNGPDVKVNLMQGKKVVATANGTLKAEKADNTAIITDAQQGTPVVQAIRLGKKGTVVLNQ